MKNKSAKRLSCPCGVKVKSRLEVLSKRDLSVISAVFGYRVMLIMGRRPLCWSPGTCLDGANLHIPESQSGDVLSTENSLALEVARNVMFLAATPCLWNSLGSTLEVARDVVSLGSAPSFSEGVCGRKSDWVGFGFGVRFGNGLSCTLEIARDVVPFTAAPCFGESLGRGLGLTLGNVFAFKEVTGDTLEVAGDVVSLATTPCFGGGESIRSAFEVAGDIVSLATAPWLGVGDSGCLNSGCC